MKFIHLTFFHLKRLLDKNWGLYFLTILMPIIVISGLFLIENSDSQSPIPQEYLILNHSREFQDNILNVLDQEYRDKVTVDSEEAYHKLNQTEITMLYEIPETFLLDDSKIKVYSLNGKNSDPLFESQVSNIIRQKRVDEILETNNIEFEPVEVEELTVTSTYTLFDIHLVILIFMTVLFMSYTIGIIAGDLAKMRNEGLLKRSIVSNAQSWELLGSVLMAYTIYNIVASFIIITSVSLVFQIPLTNILMLIGIIISFCIFIVGMTMALFRLFKDEQVILMVGLLLTLLLTFLPILEDFAGGFAAIQFISPFYWLFEMLDTGKTFPHLLMIILYGIVLFTAGSFKIEKLAKV